MKFMRTTSAMLLLSHDLPVLVAFLVSLALLNPHFRGFVQIPTLAVFALDHLNDVFPVFGPSVQVRMMTTNVCRTFH